MFKIFINRYKIYLYGFAITAVLVAVNHYFIQPKKEVKGLRHQIESMEQNITMLEDDAAIDLVNQIIKIDANRTQETLNENERRINEIFDDNGTIIDEPIFDRVFLYN